MPYLTHPKLLDLWLPLALFSSSAAILGSHLSRGIYPGSGDLLSMIMVFAGVAVVCGCLAGVFAAIAQRSPRAGLWMLYKVALGTLLFMVAGAALGSVGNRAIAQATAEGSKNCDLGTSYEDSLTMLGSSLVGLVLGLWWGIARGGVAIGAMRRDR
jgi:hypothetical protein